jgi:uncharacterized protein YycO
MYQPAVGDYGVVKTGGFFGKLIRLGTLSRWNHTFIYVGSDKIIEATPRGVILSPVNNYPEIGWNKHEELTNTQRIQIHDFAMSTLGKPYNFVVIANLMLRILGFKLLANTRLLHRLSQHDGFICSELVAEAYAKAGITLIEKPVDQVTPGDLAERLIYQ